MISRSFENIYIGWGLKTTHNHFISGGLMQEFQDSEEIAEIDDPTPQQVLSNLNSMSILFNNFY